MHNLHYCRVWAPDPETACQEVESQIMEWGNENNWRCIGGCVSQDNEIYVHDTHSRWIPEDGHTIETINDMVTGWLIPSKYYQEKFHNCVWGKEETPFDWYSAAEYCKHMYEKKVLGKDTFDVLQDTFFEWVLDKCGVSDIAGYGEGDNNKIYIVYLDMHS